MTDPQIYWELKDEDGAVTASGWADSIKRCLIDIGIEWRDSITLPPGLCIDGAPNRLKTQILDVSTENTND